MNIEHPTEATKLAEELGLGLVSIDTPAISFVGGLDEAGWRELSTFVIELAARQQPGVGTLTIKAAPPNLAEQEATRAWRKREINRANRKAKRGL